MQIKVSVGSKSFPVEIGAEEGSISTLGQLRARVSEEANIDSSRMKIIHRGKTITGADDISLLELNFKENDKVLIMGKVSAALKVFGFRVRTNFCKFFSHVIGVARTVLLRAVATSQSLFISVEKSLEMAKKMEKRLAHFSEASMKHIEAIDALNIIGELTSEAQAVRNREKRKSLIDGINTLLNGSDRHVRRLEEYRKKLLGEIVE
ncbi:unnamed protein product [Heligmosomoides polygyrus]|uniref:BAG family molecular chaperone regulator 1 n=1 Tax=Heligmosomoides polygyrus TaxID=6339 RepID=A0A183F2R7_HELPZ|nr:unnamed protein product [Heligmosomoides polygyrus]